MELRTKMAAEVLTRREMLSRSAGAVVLAGGAAISGYFLYDPVGDAGIASNHESTRYLKNYFAAVEFPSQNPRISVATGAKDRIEKMVRAAMNGLDANLGIKRFVAPGDVVFVKPNMGFDRPPKLGATTHPEVLAAVIRLCKEAGAKRVLVADNPIESVDVCLVRSGIGAVIQQTGASLVLPHPRSFRTYALGRAPGGQRAGKTGQSWPLFSEPLVQADKVIGVAPVKDHNLSSASMSLKNWYGMLGGRRNQLHQAIHETISDLASMFSPTLVIADGTRVMMRNGPTGGRISDVRPGGVIGRPVVVASIDPVACDAWCYENLLGRNPAGLSYLHAAYRKIGAQIAAGTKRLCQSNWRDYDRHGLIVSADL